MTQALDYGRRAERQRSEEPDVDPQVRFCERGRPLGRSLLDPTASAVGMRRRIHAARVAGDRIPFARYADLFLPRTAPTAEAVGRSVRRTARTRRTSTRTRFMSERS